MLVMPEPLIVGVPWNAISNTFELFGLCYLTNLFEVGMGLTERTFLENQGCPMGLHFHRRDLHGKHRSSNGSPVFTQKDLYGKRRFAQWAFIFFWRGLLWKLEVVQLTLCFHTKDLPGKWGGPMDLLFHRRDLHGKLKGPKRVFVFTKRIFHGKQKGPSISIMH